MYDIIIIGGGASGLSCSIFAPKDLKKVVLEKNHSLGKKIILSWGERCNMTNIDLSPEENYFGENTKAVHSLFTKFSNYDMIEWVEKRKVGTCIEDRWRVILESGKSQDLLELLTKESKKNGTEIRTGYDIVKIEKIDDIFYIHASNWDVAQGRNLVIATGWKSFSQVGTDGFGYLVAKQFGLEIIDPYRWLCGMITREDVSELSGSTLDLTLSLFDGKKLVYNEQWGLLFTHVGLSGPIAFNAVLALGEHIRKNGIKESQQKAYFEEHITIKLTFNEESMTRKVRNFFGLTQQRAWTTSENSWNLSWKSRIETSRTVSRYGEWDSQIWTQSSQFSEVVLHLQDLKPWNEAKVTGGGVKLDELTNTFESKKIEHLFFIGETLDLTGKSGGFNLQQAWSTGYVCGKSFW